MNLIIFILLLLLVFVFIYIFICKYVIDGPHCNDLFGYIKSITGGKNKNNKNKPLNNNKTLNNNKPPNNHYDRVKDLTKHPRTKSEAAVIALLEELTHKKFPTVNPGWLVYNGKSLELDGYNEELKLALEFSGPLHRKWYPNVESYESYLRRVDNDKAKLRICKEHGVNLIVIDMDLPRRHWRNYLVSRLFDYGIIESAPTYIAPQVFEPWIREF